MITGAATQSSEDVKMSAFQSSRRDIGGDAR